MELIHLLDTDPLGFDDPQLRRGRLLDAQEPEPRIRLVEKPLPIRGFALLGVQHLEHRQVVRAAVSLLSEKLTSSDGATHRISLSFNSDTSPGCGTTYSWRTTLAPFFKAGIKLRRIRMAY